MARSCGGGAPLSDPKTATRTTWISTSSGVPSVGSPLELSVGGRSSAVGAMTCGVQPSSYSIKGS